VRRWIGLRGDAYASSLSIGEVRNEYLSALFAKGVDRTQKKHLTLFFSKLIITSYILYHINHFYYYSNKKITTKQFFLTFYTKHSYFLPHINQIYYSSNPLHFLSHLSNTSIESNSCLRDEKTMSPLDKRDIKQLFWPPRG
jgi:hypothetical protein